MAVQPIGRFSYPQSLAQLTRDRGFGSELTGFLMAFARKDFIYYEWDFQETAITDDPNAMWTVANSGGVSAADFAKTAHSEDGRIVGDTGTTDDGGVALYFDSIMFDAVARPGLHLIGQIDDVSEAGFEVGYFDALSSEVTLGFTDLDTAALANGGTDAFAFVYDTDSATNDCVVLATGGTTDGDAVKVFPGLTAGTVADPFADATDFDLVLQGFQNGAYGIIDEDLSYSGGLATGPDTAKLMRPRVCCVTRNTTAKFPQIDLIRIWADRRGA